MTNWCTSYVTIHFSKKEKALTFMQKLEEFQKIPCAKDNDFGERWLGNMLLYLGIKLE